MCSKFNLKFSCPRASFAYNPNRRQEVWRFFTYMFLHADGYHIGFNCLLQVIVGEQITESSKADIDTIILLTTGIPLEMEQKALGWMGSVHVALLYFAGVVMGCLVSSLHNPCQILVGASAGVYALIFGHLGKETV